MNKNRRDKLKTIILALDEMIAKLNVIYNEEQFAFDNIPENLQESLRAEAMEEGLETLEEVIDDLDDIRGKLEDLT